MDVESILPNDKDSLCDSGLDNDNDDDILDVRYEKMKRDGELGYAYGVNGGSKNNTAEFDTTSSIGHKEIKDIKNNKIYKE